MNMKTVIQCFLNGRIYYISGISPRIGMTRAKRHAHVFSDTKDAANTLNKVLTPHAAHCDWKVEFNIYAA